MQQFIYLKTLCKEPDSCLMIDTLLERYPHRVVDEYIQQGARWKTFLVDDVSELEGLSQGLDWVHDGFPKVKYLLLLELGNPEGDGQYRIHINRQGRKIVTKKARKRVALSM